MLFNFSPQWRVSVIRTWTIALLMIQFSFWRNDEATQHSAGIVWRKPNPAIKGWNQEISFMESANHIKFNWQPTDKITTSASFGYAKWTWDAALAATFSLPLAS
jgi:hypothetical protein